MSGKSLKIDGWQLSQSCGILENKVEWADFLYKKILYISRLQLITMTFFLFLVINGKLQCVNWCNFLASLHVGEITSMDSRFLVFSCIILFTTPTYKCSDFPPAASGKRSSYFKHIKFYDIYPKYVTCYELFIKQICDLYVTYSKFREFKVLLFIFLFLY